MRHKDKVAREWLLREWILARVGQGQGHEGTSDVHRRLCREDGAARAQEFQAPKRKILFRGSN